MNALEVIGAFVDRERVDPDALKLALSSDEGREYLVDLVALREVTAAEAPPTELSLVRKDHTVLRPLALAAAIVVSVLGGYLAGSRGAAPGTSATPAVAVSQPALVPVIPAAPAPTTVITLEPGVDWNASTGG